MRPFNRSDLGRLYVSPAGERSYTYLGDASLDGIASSGTVTYNGVAYGLPSAGKAWTGAITARSGEALLAISREFSEMDLLVTYGDERCPVASFDSAVLVEGAVVSGEQWGPLTSLASGMRSPVSATCQFTARNLRRAVAGDILVQRTALTGSVVALTRAAGRLYALCAQPSGAETDILLRLAWSDNGRDWAAAPITHGTMSEPIVYGMAYLQFSLRVIGDVIYIATGADLLSVRAPLDREAPAALYAAAVRPPGVSSASVVGLAILGGDLYARTSSSGYWRIDATGAVSVHALRGSTYRGIVAGDNEFVTWKISGYERVRPGIGASVHTWSDGNLAWMSANGNNSLALTSDGGVWTPAAAGWRKRSQLPGVPLATAEAGGAVYAIVSSGTLGSRLVMSLGDPERWVQLDGKARDLICLLPVGDGVLVGGQDLATGANRSTGPKSITRCRNSGFVYLASSSESLIVG